MDVSYYIVDYVSCRISIDEFASTTPVKPPIVNRNTNHSDHRHVALYVVIHRLLLVI
jgi:hypothetical protein